MTAKERASALVPYIRQSVEKEVTISLDEQRAKVRAWAEVNSVDLLTEVLDEGVSSGKPWRERRLAGILADVRAGRAGGVIVAYSSRLSREGLSAQHEIAENFGEAGGRVVAVDRGIDTAVPGWEYLFSMDAIEKKNHLAEIGSRWEVAKRMAVERGVHVAPRVPTGYDRTLVQATKNGAPVFDKKTGEPKMTSGPLVPNAHAPAVRLLFEMRASGANWGECRRAFESAGVPNHRGLPVWTPRALANIMANAVYTGEARYGEFKNPGAHEPIVDAATWRAAQRKAPGVQCTRVAPQSLLGGLVRCSSCGRPMSPVSGGLDPEARARYMCRTNRHGNEVCPAPASCWASDLDDSVSRAFLLVVPRHFAAGPKAPDTRPLERALGEARTRYEALLATDLLSIDPTAFSRMAAEGKGAIEAAEDDLRAASAGTGLAKEAGTIQARWGGMDVGERRRWLRLWGFRVTVEPGRGVPLDERVMLSWEPQPLRREEVVPATIRDLIAEAGEGAEG